MVIIRQLTAAGKAAAQKARDLANARIKAAREALIRGALQTKYGRLSDRQTEAIKQLPLMSYNPVMVTDGERSLVIDYDRPTKFCRSLRKGWTMSVRLYWTELELTYRHPNGGHGSLVLRGLPANHLHHLQGVVLPTIDLSEKAAAAG